MNTATLELMHLLTRLNLIAATSKTKEKEVMLKEALQDANFRSLVDLMLNPYKTYGILDFQHSPANCNEPGVTFEHLELFMRSLEERKLTGNVAREACANMVAGGVPRDLLIRILEGDPKAGFGTTLVNKVYPGLLPEFPYMRCSLPEKSNMGKWDWAAGIISQEKADGMFMNVNLDFADQVQLLSRQGQIFPEKGFEQFHQAVRQHLKPGTQTHGEMIVFCEGKILDRQTGNGIINSVAQGGEWVGPEGGRVAIKFLAWDQIPLSEVKAKNKYKVNYDVRFTSILHQIGDGQSGILTPIPFRMVYSKKEAYEHFAEIVGQGGEGTVVKDPKMFWADGTSKDQVKLKLAFVVDVKIVGFTIGKGKFAATFGAVMYESADGLLKGQVSGMDDKTRDYVHKNREFYLDKIMAVEANAIFKPSASNPFHSLSHPRVVEFRNPIDKRVADTLAECFAQERAAIENAAAI